MSNKRSNGNDPQAEPETTTVDPGEIEAIGNAAEAIEAEGIEADEYLAAEAISDEGQVKRRAITPRDLMGPGEKDQMLAELMVQPIGTFFLLGSLVGKVAATEEQTNEYKGEKLKSIVCIGAFDLVNARTGEITQSTRCYLPLAEAEDIAASLLLAPGSKVVIDCDIGIEKTGRNIPYMWTVKSHTESEMQRDLLELKRYRQARASRKQAKRLGGPSGRPTATIEGTVAPK